MQLTLCRIADKPPNLKSNKIKRKSPEPSGIGAFGYTLFSDTGALGGFVAFTGSRCKIFTTVLLRKALQSKGVV